MDVWGTREGGCSVSAVNTLLQGGMEHGRGTHSVVVLMPFPNRAEAGVAPAMQPLLPALEPNLSSGSAWRAIGMCFYLSAPRMCMRHERVQLSHAPLHADDTQLGAPQPAKAGGLCTCTDAASREHEWHAGTAHALLPHLNVLTLGKVQCSGDSMPRVLAAGACLARSGSWST